MDVLLYKGNAINIELPAFIEAVITQDRARHQGRHRLGLDQARHDRDGRRGAGAAVREGRREDPRRHAHGRVRGAGQQVAGRSGARDERRSARAAVAADPAPRARRYGVGLDDLAAELECHKRTVYRDLDALQFAGLPGHQREARRPRLLPPARQLRARRGALHARRADGARLRAKTCSAASRAPSSTTRSTRRSRRSARASGQSSPRSWRGCTTPSACCPARTSATPRRARRSAR